VAVAGIRRVRTVMRSAIGRVVWIMVLWVIGWIAIRIVWARWWRGLRVSVLTVRILGPVLGLCTWEPLVGVLRRKFAVVVTRDCIGLGQ
jgi:hypothetical protein